MFTVFQPKHQFRLLEVPNASQLVRIIVRVCHCARVRMNMRAVARVESVCVLFACLYALAYLHVCRVFLRL